MTGRLRRSWRLVLKELSAFGVVGGVCFLIDVGLFQVLYAHVGLGAVTAKFLSTVVSMTVAYVGHRYWSFSHRARTGVRREYLLFAVINGGPLLPGRAFVVFVRSRWAREGALFCQAATLASIFLATLIRYFSYRRWVSPAPDWALPRPAAPAPGTSPRSTLAEDAA